MKHQVVVNIDCNEKTCGNCEWVGAGDYIRDCCLYADEKYVPNENLPTELKFKVDENGKYTVYRCKACIKNCLSKTSITTKIRYFFRMLWLWITGILVCYEMCPHNGEAWCKRRRYHLGRHSTGSGFSWNKTK